MTARLKQLTGARLPVIQAGTPWVAGAALAAAASRAGCLGLVAGGGTMPLAFRETLREARRSIQDGMEDEAPEPALGVSIPLFGKYAEEQMSIALSEKIQVFVTSQGDPSRWTPFLKKYNRKVLHICKTPGEALRAANAGVDAIIAQGTESGGDNSRAQLTTMSLLPLLVDDFSADMPVIASGGIADGRGIAAAMALGAEGVQMDSRFAATQESSAHPNFKELMLRSTGTDTMLFLRSSTPVRAIKNAYSRQIEDLVLSSASYTELRQFRGEGRTRLGVFLGDLARGELDCSQNVGLIKDIVSVEEAVRRLMEEYAAAVGGLAPDLEAPTEAEESVMDSEAVAAQN